MSALLRSIAAVRLLTNFAGTSVCSRAPKLHSVNVAVKTFHTQNPRFLAIQQNSLRRTEGEVYNNELSHMLERLNTESRLFGRISYNLFKGTVALLKDTDSVSSSQALVMLRCCGALMSEELPAERTEFAHSIWENLEKRGCQLDLSHYNALLRVYIENEHNFAPAEFLDRLKTKNIAPNRVTYQRLIARYAQLGDIEGATKVLEAMKEQDLPINENIFHALILGHARAGDLKNAKDMLSVMQESGLEPSAETYLALAVAQAEQGDITALKETISLSVEKDEALHDRHLMEVLFSLASKGHSDHVPEIIKLLKKEWGYNQDCKNLIFRLINAGCDDAAHLLYGTMDSIADANTESSFNKGAFYVRHLVARDRPLSSILGVCEDLSGENTHLLQRSLEVALSRNHNLVYPIMDAILAKGATLRPHYFWPLIAHSAKAQDYNGVLDVLENMKKRSTTINLVTMLDYALPALRRDPSMQVTDIVNKLEKVGVSFPDAVNSIAQFFVRQDDLSGAVELLQRYRMRIAPGTRRSLAIATVRTKDYWSAAALIGQVRVGRQSNLPAEEDGDAAEAAGEEHGASEQNEDVVGRFLLDVNQRAGSIAKDFDWVALLSAVKDRGLSISRELEATLSHALGSRATPQVNDLLGALASGTLSKVQLERGPPQTPYNKMSIARLEEALESCTASGRDPKSVLTNLLVAYCNTGEVEKAENVLKELEETHEFPVGVGLSVVIISMYHTANLSQPAFNMLEKIRQIEPDALLSSKVILRLANLYVNEGRIEDAAEFLETEAKKRHAAEEEIPAPEGQDHFSELLCNRILVPVSAKGDLEMLERLKNAILDGRFAPPSRRLLSPIVRAHLEKGDLESAWSSVVEYKRNYNVIPYRKVLAQTLIEREDTDKLQQLVDMATDLYGEHSSLFDLACSFVDMDRIKEAKRVLQTPGLRVRSEYITRVCQYYLREKKTRCIEGLLAASAEVSYFDRRFLYQYLLEAYINDGDCSKALGLWTQLQEEDLPITDKFMRDLGMFLQQNDKPVPFAIPEEMSYSSPKPVSQETLRLETTVPEPFRKHAKLVEFHKLLDDEKLDEALSLHTEMLASKDKSLVIKLSDSFALAERLFNANRLNDTVQMFKESRTLRGLRGSALLRRVGATLADQGDYESIENLMDSNRNYEKSLALSLCKAAELSNNIERCFSKIEKMVEEASLSESPQYLDPFSISGFLSFVEKDSSLLIRLESLSDKMKAKGEMAGFKTLWAYHFVHGNSQEVQRLSEELKRTGTTFSFVPVLHLCRGSNDVALAENLISYMKTDPPADHDRAVASAYSCLIDVLCAKNSPREALKVLEESLKSLPLGSLSIPTLRTLSKLLAAENIPFPYQIPGNSKVKAETVSA